MSKQLLPPILLTALALSLPGCAGPTEGYPSLAPRPIEREVLQAAPVPAAPDPTAAAPLPLSADIAALVAQAQAADTAFRAAVEKARPQVEAGRGADEGSERWVNAQQAYSSAEAARAPVTEALAELDRRREVAATAGDVAGEAGISAALEQVQALDEAERALLSALMPA